MSELSVQFYILPDEVTEIFSELIQDENVFVTLVRGSKPISFSFALERTFDPKECQAVLFTLDRPKIEVQSIYEFLGFNPSALLLKIGHLTPIGLSESWLSSKPGDERSAKRWRNAIQSLKKSTQTGAFAKSPRTGQIVLMRSLRFSVAAQMCFEAGTVIIPCGGNSIIKLSKI